MAVFPVRIAAIAAKMHTTYDTDPVPALATDAIRFLGIPLATFGVLEEGDRPDAQHGGMGEVGRAAAVGDYVNLDVPIELFGKGTAYSLITDPFQHDCFLRGAGLAKSLVGGNSLWYIDTDQPGEYFALYLWGVDGNLYKAINCTAKPKVSLVRGKPGVVTYSVEGRLAGIVGAQPLTGLALPSVIPPVWANVTTTIGAWSSASGAPNQLLATKLDLDFGTMTKMRDWAGANALLGPAVVDRNPVASMEVEAVPLTTFDPFARSSEKQDGTATATAISTSLNGGAGNTVFVNTGQWQLKKPKQLNLGGLAGWGLEGKIIARSGGGSIAGRAFSISVQ